MKKLIVPAFCLSLFFGSSAMVAANTMTENVVMLNDDGRKAVKPEELPEPVRKTLAGTDYKGWTVKEAFVVNSTVPGDATTPKTWYEVTVTNGKDSKQLNLNPDGTLAK